MNILIDENIPGFDKLGLKNLSILPFNGRKLSNKDIIEAKAEILIVRSTTKVNEELLNGSQVKFVGTATSGFDHLDLKYLEQAELQYYIAKGCNANSVAEYVIFGILHWTILNGVNLKDKSIGIVGYGNVGSIVAKYSKHIGLNVFINDPPLFENQCVYDYKYLHLNEIIPKVDILTIHTPLTKDGNYPTKYLLNNSNLAEFNPHGLIINAARGGIVQEEYLIDNKTSSIIDVWENEPDYNIDFANQSLIATPHIAGYSRNAKLNGAYMCYNAINEYLKNNGLESHIYYLKENELPNLKHINNFGIDEIYKILLKNRDILKDSQSFCTHNTSFDNQRKNYPIRYESFF